MADDPKPQSQQVAAAGLSATGSMFSTTFTVPDDVRKQFPELIDLITRSESMNNEERQYWVNILPIMTPEQVKNLGDILRNERKQLAAIDAKYSKEIQKGGQESLKQVEEERRTKAKQRSSAEKKAKQDDSGTEEALLKQIEKL